MTTLLIACSMLSHYFYENMVINSLINSSNYEYLKIFLSSNFSVKENARTCCMFVIMAVVDFDYFFNAFKYSVLCCFAFVAFHLDPSAGGQALINGIC